MSVQTSQEKIMEVAFFFNSSRAPYNFAHFCLDLLPQLAFFYFVRSLGIKMVPVLSHPFKYPIMRKLFKQLVAQEYITLDHTKAYVFKDLLIPKAINSFFEIDVHPKFTDTALNFVKTKIRETFNLGKHQLDKKLFITRKDGLTENKGFLRQYSNQSELEQFLLDNGFTFVTVSDYKPLELIHLFAKAKVVVGAHGAGLLNTIFSSDSVSIIELCIPKRPKTPPCNSRFIKAYGMDIYQIPVMSHDKASIDLKKLQDRLNKVM